MLATGGSDAVINLWHDSTAADKEDEINKLLTHLANVYLYQKSYLVDLILLPWEVEFNHLPDQGFPIKAGCMLGDEIVFCIFL
ncbi:hypothetical protein L1987_29791 [Smallanthus sonchifolius]|uniref:Uncharacterized protein n=1 Tax=Smallanthus sonchifolius TaxID=185202 RepID=A0ACB9I118_9ASTR|nr:hypothetical protein L1987_29791 [Smallanthus sonchifolius]